MLSLRLGKWSRIIAICATAIVIAAVVITVFVVHGLGLVFYYPYKAVFQVGPVVKILDPQGDAIIQFPNGTKLSIRLDPHNPIARKILSSPSFRVGPIVQVYNGLDTITGTVKIYDLETGVVKKLTLHYDQVLEKRNYDRGIIIEVFKLRKADLEKLKSILERLVRNKTEVIEILSKIPYEFILRIRSSTVAPAKVVRGKSSSYEKPKSYSFTWYMKDLLNVTIGTITHTVQFTYNGTAVIHNGGVITTGAIPCYYFYNEIKVNGKVVESGFKSVSAFVKVNSWESTVELSTTIYFGIDAGKVKIGGQVGSCYTRAINYGDGLSNWYVQWNAPLNSGTESGWIDP